jgi:hypothetical protein
MHDRWEPLLKAACLVLAALLVFQLARLGVREDPLAKLSIPAVPAYVAATEVQASGKTTLSGPAQPAPKSTNQMSESGGDKRAPALPLKTVQAGTNARVVEASAPAVGKTGANQALATRETNSPSNALARIESGKPGSNSPSPASTAGRQPGAASPDPAGPRPGRPGMAPKAPDLPPEILAKVDRVYDSEVLGPVFHPMPMALLGIAGNVAFLRAPNGQTGVVKEGDEVGGLKLLRIGINRVLVEQDQEKKELTIFSGFGGESLLPK